MISVRTLINTLTAVVILLVITAIMGIVLLIKSKDIIYSYAVQQVELTTIPEPFPVGVDPVNKRITEQPGVNAYFSDSLASEPNHKDNWWNKVAAFFAEEEWYQNLASPVGRIVVIWPGQRKEEVTKHIGDILRWSNTERAEFQDLINQSPPALTEGKYYPGQYVTHRGTTPAEVAAVIEESFETEILNRYHADIEEQIPLADTLTIASLLEREASDFENMREISGVIWNRLFTDMPLQLDATLQYIRGSKSYEPAWWPTPRPQDKYLSSPYNTYKHAGLPPGPIANPSAEAVLAALNPVQTDCLFYFHSRGDYYCSPTYEEHVAKLRSIYGRGK